MSLDEKNKYASCSEEVKNKYRKELSAFDRSCIKHYPREFSQASVCQEMYNVQTLITVQNSAAIVHGPTGCISSAFGINSYVHKGFGSRLGGQPQNIKWYTTNLSENEVIQGGEEKLIAAIENVDKEIKPEVIFIFTSCVAGIIGDDVVSITKKIQGRTNAKLVPVICEGFRRPKWGSTCDVSYEGIIQHIIEDRPKEKNLVNIINALTVSGADEREIERLLNMVGLKANFMPAFSSIEGIRRSVSAEVATSVCHSFGDNFNAYLNEKYGIPVTEKNVPQSIASTDKWLLELAKIFNIEEAVNKLIESEHKKMEAKLQEYRTILNGKKVFVGASLSRAVTLAELAEDLGFELTGLSSFLSKEAEDGKKNSQSLNVANILPFEQANIIRRLQPDVYIARGITVPYSSFFGVPVVSIYDYNTCSLGYQGVLDIGKRLVNAVKNPNYYKKLAQHKQRPYKESWYDENPFKFIKPEKEIKFNY